MFYSDALKLYPENTKDAVMIIGLDALVTYIAPIETKAELFDFLHQFCYTEKVSSHDGKKIPVTFETIIDRWEIRYGYVQTITHFIGTYNGRKITGVHTTHRHEDGIVWYWMNFNFYGGHDEQKHEMDC